MVFFSLITETKIILFSNNSQCFEIGILKINQMWMISSEKLLLQVFKKVTASKLKNNDYEYTDLEFSYTFLIHLSDTTTKHLIQKK